MSLAELITVYYINVLAVLQVGFTLQNTLNHVTYGNTPIADPAFDDKFARAMQAV